VGVGQRDELTGLINGEIGNMPHRGDFFMFIPHHKVDIFFITPNVAPVLIAHQVRQNRTLMLIFFVFYQVTSSYHIYSERTVFTRTCNSSPSNLSNQQ